MINLAANNNICNEATICLKTITTKLLFPKKDSIYKDGNILIMMAISIKYDIYFQLK